jgi:dTDP-4-dehydrorhamnose 3,5-epimerase
MEIRPLRISGAFEIRFEVKQDERGHFMRSYDQTIFALHALNNSWVQENEAFSVRKGVVRGLHFQRPPYAETKLVRVVQGAILDVFVDVRRSSPTYCKWEMIELSAANHKAVYVPKGCAHGYCTLSDLSTVLYKVDCAYAPQFEGGLRWNDGDLAIPWPIREPLISSKDAGLPTMIEFISPFD